MTAPTRTIPPDPDPARSCHGKKRYVTKEHADRVARACEEKRGTPLRVYGCEVCGGHHLTARAAQPVEHRPGWRPAELPWNERRTRPAARRRRR